MLEGTVGDATRLEYRVLGPVEVWRGAQRLRLGGERQRALLALLLLHANELVSTDRLVDQLFGIDAGEDGVRALRVAVSRLRRALVGDGDPGPLLTGPGGYLVQIEPSQLDVAVFESLLEDARRMAAVGDSVAAAAKLRDALLLWRGPPLADLASFEFAVPEIRRLEELRLTAVMDRIDADLAAGRAQELIAELEALVVHQPLQERARGQLMLALYRAGRQADALAVYRQTSELLRDELGLEPSRALQDLERAILQQDVALELPPGARDRVSAVCPFKGLAAFERSDAEYFCGRERLISDLIARLAQSPFVGLVGPSGVGKSSALRAGVLAALSDGALPASAGWEQALIRPGPQPCEELDRALRSVGAGRCVLAVDQLEELFTACGDGAERAEFLAKLVKLSADPGGAIVLVSLRADFYGHCASYPQFAQLLSRSHVLVGPMERDEVRRAIELPAKRAGLAVERDLIDALTADVAGQPGGLPLMSTALLELWRTRDGAILDYRAYRRSGGVGGAVARLAEDSYGRLAESDRSVARRVMLRLAADEGGALVRRRLRFSDLEAIDPGRRVSSILAEARLLTISNDEVELAHETLLYQWPRYRTWIEEDRTGRRLRGHLATSAREWADRGRDPGELYRGGRLAAVSEWASQHVEELTEPEREFVAASVAAEEMQRRRERTQNRRLRGLLAGACVLLACAIAAGVLALVKQRSAARDARIALGGQLGAEAVSEPRIDLAMLLAREAVSLDSDQQTQGTLLATLLRSPAAIATFELPLVARPQGITLSPDGRTLAVTDNTARMRFYDARTHAVQRPPLTGVRADDPVYSPDGRLLLHAAASTGRPFIAVRDAHTLALVRALQLDQRAQTTATSNEPTGSYALSPDDRTAYYGYWALTSSGGAGTAYLDRWSLTTGKLLRVTALGPGPLLALRLIAGGSRLAVLRADGADVYDAGSLRRMSSHAIEPALDPGDCAGISPDGRSAVVGSPIGSVSFVDIARGTVRQALGGHSRLVARALYSPDGRVAVTIGNDNEVIVWDPVTATAVQELSGHGGAVHGATFSADGRTLYTSSLDGTVIEWDLGGGRRFGRPFALGAGLPNPPPDNPGTPPLAMSPDGLRFAVRIGAATVGVFSSETLRRQSSFRTEPRGGAITALAWSPRGSVLAVAAHSGVLQLWSVAGRPRRLASLAGFRPRYGLPEAVQDVAFSRDGRLLAASDVQHTPSPTGLPDGHAAVWRVASRALMAPPYDLREPGDSIALSPDGRLLAAGLDGGPVLLLDATRARLLRTLHPLGGSDYQPIVSLAFAPNGTLATGSWTGVVQLWNPSTSMAVAHPVLVAVGAVASIDFDPTGQRFSTTGSDGTTKLWFANTLHQEGSALQGDPGEWGNARFSPSGATVTVAYDDGKAFQWPATLAAWERHACAVAGRNFTAEEWSRFVPGHPYARVCR